MQISISVDGCTLKTAAGLVKGAELRTLANIPPDEHLVINRAHALDVPVKDSDYLVLTGDEQLVTGRNSHMLPDNPCLGKPITITVNDTPFELKHAKVTLADLRELAGADATDGVFLEMPQSADEPLANVERLVVQDGDAFITVPCGNVGDHNTTGVGVLHDVHHDFQQLQQHYPSAEIHPDGAGHLVVIRGVPLPTHWSSETVDMLFPVSNLYPQTALDMFWVSPKLSLKDGRQPENAVSFDRQYLGGTWQGFSWHYPPANPWMPGKNNLLSHLRFSLSRLHQNR